MTKSQLEDFNVAEACGWIIERFRQIEYLIDFKIVKFFKPTEESFLSIIE